MSRFHFYQILTLMIMMLLTGNGFSQIRIQRSLTVEDGLLQSQITALHEDREGYLWLGSLGGITRWDGIHFENFSTEDGLAAASVVSIAEADDGRLYFGTYGGGLSIYDHGQFRNINKSAGLSGNIVMSICIDKRGTAYLGTLNNGITLLADNQISIIDSTRGLPVAGILALTVLSDQSIAVGTRGAGMALLKDDEITILNTTDGLADNTAWAICETSPGEVYIGTNNGLSIYRQGRFDHKTTNDGLSSNRIRSIFKSADGSIYLGTLKGVNILHKDNITQIKQGNGLTSNAIMSMLQSSDGSIFIGTNGGGANIYYPEKFITYNADVGLSGNIVLAIESRQNGDIVAGSYRGGLSITNSKRKFPDNKIFESVSIPALLAADDGSFYVGTEGLGVARYRNGRREMLNQASGLIHNSVTCLFQSKTGAVYVGTIAGLSKYEGNQFQNVILPGENSGRIIMDIAESPGGEIFVATLDGGLKILSEAGNRTIRQSDGLASDRLYALYQDSSDILFVGSDRGITLLDPRGTVIRNIDKKNGLSNNKIHGISRIDDNKILLTTNRGLNILTFNGTDLTDVRVISSRDGLANNECNQGALLQGDDGRIWVGTLKGLTCYNPKKDFPNLNPPKVHITDMHVFDQRISPEALSQSGPFTYDQNYFKFDYIGIDLIAADKVRYQYRMSGIDRDWTATERRFVQYTNLDPGRYTFEVRAGNEWHSWSAPQRISFSITPPFWQTWWFRLLIAALVVGILWLLYHIRLSRLLEIEQLRTRIASDLHDDIGSLLTKIAVNSEVVQNHLDKPEKVRALAQKAGNLSREVIQMFSDTIWSIDSRNDSLGDLSARMQEFATRMLDPQEISYQQRLKGLALNHPLSPEIRQNLFFIFKEAIHNIAKHSRAKNVEVMLHQNDNGFSMQIEDDGIGGFTTENTSGQGLRNMKMRARTIKGQFEITTADGCHIKISLPAF